MMEVDTTQAVAILREIYRGYKRNPERAKSALHGWLKIFLGIHIPSRRIKPGHQSPFDFLCAVYFEEYPDIIAHANRNGGKTLLFALLDLLNSLTHDECETTSTGAIEQQAIKCYRYFQKFCKNIPFVAEQIVDSLMSQTTFVDGSTVQIITGTITGVNSPHPHKSFIDEVDLMDWMVLQEAFSMAKSSDTIQGQNILASTQKGATGPMSRLLSGAKGLGFKTFTWSIHEVIEPHHKRDTLNTPLYEDLKDYYDKDGYYPSDGYYKVKDAIAKKKKLDPEVWETQWLCEKPEKTGLMYPQFTELTYPEGNLQKWAYDEDYDLYIFEDFGFGENHPNVDLLVQVLDYENPKIQIFDELYLKENTSVDVVPKVAKLLNKHHIPVEEIKSVHSVEGIRVFNFSEFVTGWAADPAGLTEKADRVRMGCPMMDKADDSKLYHINNGASFLRRMFRDRRLLIDPRCVKLIEELNTYRKKRLSNGEYTDTPEKKHDHGPDATRYGVLALFPVEALGSFGGDFEEKQEEALGPITSDLLDINF